jgi:hypothetical protein
MCVLMKPFVVNIIKFVNDASSRSTRAHKFKLRIPLVGAEAPESSFSVKGCRLWNKLSDEMCLISNIDAFKCKLKSMFFKRYEEN